MLLDAIFTECVTRDASDIHVKEWEPIMLRVDGKLVKSSESTLPNKIVMFDLLYTLLFRKKERISYFKHNFEVDFWYTHKDGTSYRGNAYMYMGKIAVALRKIPETIQNLVELGMPKSLKKVLQAKQWLFLVTGPTGNGKSTTMASMLDAINEFRNEHIITIEDPIEYVFKNKQSIFSQREIGRDTLSFWQAIRSAMREDADIIMIGEIRDSETMEIALSLAETGHLVFSTLHTSGSVQTINRMIQFFPAIIEAQIRTRIAESLIWVLSQRLILKKDQSERVAIREIMYVNSGIKNLITKWDLSQIPNMIQLSQWDGMNSMQRHAESLRDAWVIEERAYAGYFVNQTSE